MTLTSRKHIEIGKGAKSKRVEEIVVDWTAAADGSVTDLSLPLYGYLVKVIVNPGTTAPTGNYDITLEDPEDNALDAFSGQLINRSATVTEHQVYPFIATSLRKIFLAGTYNLAIANNSVDSATGKIKIYLADEE